MRPGRAPGAKFKRSFRNAYGASRRGSGVSRRVASAFRRFLGR